VFHFLTEVEERAAYVAALKARTNPGASVVMATFAPDGPQRCTGLPVRRYSSGELADLLGSCFVLTDSSTEGHYDALGFEAALRVLGLLPQYILSRRPLLRYPAYEGPLANETR